MKMREIVIDCMFAIVLGICLAMLLISWWSS